MAAGYKFEWKKRSVYKCVQIMCVVLMAMILINICHNLNLMCKIETLTTDFENSSENKHSIIIEFNEAFQDDELKNLGQYWNETINELKISVWSLAILLVVLVIAALPQNTKEMQLIRKNRELEVAAYIDKITGLPSRRSCEEKIWTPINPRKAPYCVVIFDLNNLKKVNDQYGHHEGDRLIKGFACILENISNDRVFAGRYGGDEFILIAHGYNKERIQRILNKIALLVEHHNIQNDRPQIQYAVGYSFEGVTLRDMIDLADERMYVNKKAMKEKKSPTVKVPADCISL